MRRHIADLLVLASCAASGAGLTAGILALSAWEPTAPTPVTVTVFEDGSYRFSDGTVGCIPEQLCDDNDGGTR